MFNRDVNGTLEEIDSFDNYILLNNQDIIISYRERA
jgi:small nuclear ribonucleoprotein (snRNP)-like protein